jgi:hypothetical protein
LAGAKSGLCYKRRKDNPVELTYMIRGDDGQQYGPATLEQLTGWAREGRVNHETELQRSDMQYWSSAGSFTELAGVLAPVAAVPTPAVKSLPRPANDPAMAAQLKSGSSWFYWIAALSLINSFVAISGNEWRFIIGLGVTQILDAIGAQIGGAGKFVALALDFAVAGVLVFFGVFAGKRHLWAFIVGMVLIGLDGLVFLLGQNWLGVGFHVFVIFFLFRGVQACRALNAG